MTLAFYISPSGIPAIGADILVSSNFTQERVYKTPFELLVQEQSFNRHYFVGETRKLTFYDQYTAAAFSGDIHSILECHVQLKNLLNIEDRPSWEFSDPMSPMKILQSYVTEQRDRYQVIACRVYNDVGPQKQYANHFVSPWGLAQSDDCFQQVRAIGSGMDYFELFYNNVYHNYINITDPLIKIAGFFGHINNKLLYSQIFGYHPVEENWGGFIEGAYFDQSFERWSMVGSWLHMHINAIRLFGNRMFFNTVPFFTFYFPELGDKGILVYIRHKDKYPLSYNLVLNSILNETNDRLLLPGTQKNLKPDYVSIGIYEKANFPSSSIYQIRTCPMSSLTSASCNLIITNNKIEYSVNMDMHIKELIQLFCISNNLINVKTDKLTIEERVNLSSLGINV
jgi:hypothetical protein